MKILVATAYFPPSAGGMQYQNLDIARGLAQLGHEVMVLAPVSPGWRAFDAGEPYAVIRMPVEHGPVSLRRIAVGVRFLLRGWTRLRPDRVLTLDDRIHESYGAAWPVLPFRPVCLTVQTRLIWPGSWLWRTVRNYVLTTTFHRARRVLAITQASKDSLVRHGIDPRKIDVIYLGIDEQRFLAAPPTGRAASAALLGLTGVGERPVILTATRLEDEKGVDVAIDALEQVRRVFPHVLYVVAGDGPDRGRLENLARTRGLAAGVRFVGPLSRDQVVAAYDLCDVFVFLSRRGPREVFPLVCLEAAARARPVIGSRQGGIPEQVVHGETGLLVDQTNPSEVAGALVSLLGDPERRGAMGQAGRRRVAQLFTRTKMVEGIDAALRMPV